MSQNSSVANHLDSVRAYGNIKIIIPKGIINPNQGLLIEIPASIRDINNSGFFSAEDSAESSRYARHSEVSDTSRQEYHPALNRNWVSLPVDAPTAGALNWNRANLSWNAPTAARLEILSADMNWEEVSQSTRLGRSNGLFHAANDNSFLINESNRNDTFPQEISSSDMNWEEVAQSTRLGRSNDSSNRSASYVNAQRHPRVEQQNVASLQVPLNSTTHQNQSARRRRSSDMNWEAPQLSRAEGGLTSTSLRNQSAAKRRRSSAMNWEKAPQSARIEGSLNSSTHRNQSATRRRRSSGMNWDQAAQLSRVEGVRDCYNPNSIAYARGSAYIQQRQNSSMYRPEQFVQPPHTTEVPGSHIAANTEKPKRIKYFRGAPYEKTPWDSTIEWQELPLLSFYAASPELRPPKPKVRKYARGYPYVKFPWEPSIEWQELPLFSLREDQQGVTPQDSGIQSPSPSHVDDSFNAFIPDAESTRIEGQFHGTNYPVLNTSAGPPNSITRNRINSARGTSDYSTTTKSRSFGKNACCVPGTSSNVQQKSNSSGVPPVVQYRNTSFRPSSSSGSDSSGSHCAYSPKYIKNVYSNR